MERLPGDILLEIAHYLPTPSEILHLSLTCAGIFHGLTPALYSHVALRGAQQCAATLDMLSTHPARARHVRELRVCLAAGSKPASGQLLGARRQVLLDGYRISAAVRRAAHNMEILRAFVWDGEELPPNDDMWFALRICCTRLKYIGTAFGSILPSPKSHLFDFSDLHGFTLTFKKGFYWHHVGFTRNEPIPGYHRLWDMLIKRCPHLQELELDGDSPDDPVDAQRLTRGRWPDLRKLVLGNVVIDWHTAVNPASKRPFITFLEEHCGIETLHLVGHQPSVAAPDLLSAVQPEALPVLTEFHGSLQQIQALQNKKTLTSICVPDTIVLREGTPLSVSTVLNQIPSLTSLTLTFGLEHGYDNGSMLHALISACPQLQHLDLTYACKPSFSLDNFARSLRNLCRLRSLHLRIVRNPSEDPLSTCGLRIARTNPRLRTFTLEFLVRSTSFPTRGAPPAVQESASFELVADQHGLPSSIRVCERWRPRRLRLFCPAVVVRRYVMPLRPDGSPGTAKGGLGALLVERSPAGEDARLIFCCVLLVVLAVLSFTVFPEAGLKV
ncbi:hypothetical protein DENSPDRAFT_837798 [Dentipellis sp. KUC8613]|nr:hypothetical protein DENSPDRAFT_837798 [Dentipellis sp. KUC8613]